MSKRVTADSKFLAARTIFPLFNDEHGSSENSLAAKLIAFPKINHHVLKLVMVGVAKVVE